LDSLKDKILAQKSIGQSWGRFALAGSQIAIVVSTLTLLMASIGAYPSVSLLLKGYGISLHFWVFLSVIVFPIVVAYFLSWKYLVWSFYKSSTEQFWNQDNPFSKDIRDMKKTLKHELPKIRKRLRSLEKKQR